MDYNRTFEHWFVFAQAIQLNTPIYGVIGSLHGRLDKPLIEVIQLYIIDFPLI